MIDRIAWRAWSALMMTMTAAMAAGCAATAAAADLPPPVVPAGLGVNIHFTRPAPGEMERFAEAGYGLVRMDMSWAAIEHTRGKYDFAAHDELLGHLEKVRARPIYILDYGNPLYNHGLAPTTDADRSAFARFAAAAARHYRGKRILFEIWNEPNLDGFWKPKANQADYAKLAVAAAKAMREADPRATILAPGSSGFPWEFLETAFAAGLLEHIDAVSVHPYRGGPPESAAEDYGRLRALIGRHASPSRRGLPIISSEWGYSTTNVSEATQAMYLPRQWLSNLASGVNTSIFYDWKDDGDDAKDPEHRFGTVRRDLEPKPSFLAARTLIRTLRGHTFCHRLKGSSPGEWKLLFAPAEGAASTRQPLIIASWRAAEGASSGSNGTAPEYRKVGDADPDAKALRRLAAIRWTAGPIAAEPGSSPVLAARVANHEGSPARVEIRSQASDMPGKANVKQVTVPPSKSGGLDCPLPQRSVFSSERSAIELTITWNGETLPAVAPVDVRLTNPITLSAAPRWDRLEVVVANHRPEPIRGQLVVMSQDVRKESVPVEPLAGMSEARVHIPLGKSRHGLEFEVPNKGAVAYLPPHRYELFPGFHNVLPPEAAFTANLHVDNAGTTPKPLAVAKGGAREPASHLIEVPYQFGKGWRYLVVSPAKPMEIPAEAKAAVVWVRGNDSGDVLNCRFRDATGQVFQVALGNLPKAGWQPVTIPFEPSDKTNHWGGANDGVPHRPLQWEALLLIDSVRREQDSPPETAAFASPFYVFDR